MDKEILCFSLVIFWWMSAIWEKCSDEHFRWKFETAISWIWNLEIVSFPMMYDSNSPSQWYPWPIYTMDYQYSICIITLLAKEIMFSVVLVCQIVFLSIC